MRAHGIIVVALLLGSFSDTGKAQQADSVSTVEAQASQPGARYGAWFAGGWHAPISNYSPLRTDRAVMLVGLERRWRLASARGVALAAAPSLVPALYTTGNRRQNNVVCRDAYSASCLIGSSYAAMGVGLLPVALRVETSPNRRIGMSASADAGGALFTQRVPATKGTRFNFVARFGADVIVRARDGLWITGGYRHLHLSNGGTGQINPGIDTPLWACGIAWR